MRRSEAMRGRPWLAFADALLASGACIDSSRVNDTCTWSDPVDSRLDLARPSDRDHLRQDSQLAWELSVRYGDARYGVASLLAPQIRRGCREALENTIVVRHGVTTAEVRGASRWRVWGIDILIVFLPMILLTIVVTRAAARYVRGQTGPARRRLLLAAPTALIMAGLTQYWAMGLETLRLRNWHLADRVSALPTVNHRVLALGALFLICLLAAPRAPASREG